jgi:alanine dehydrogenase
VLALADKGTTAALRTDPHLLAGLNVYEGKITHPAVAEALGHTYFDPLRALGK